LRRVLVKILITGSQGQLGRELSEILLVRGHEVVALSRRDLDVSDPDAVDQRIEDYSPELVINAAAYTNVDACETEEELAYLINALGPRNLAQTCERRGCELLHVSTNYVFDGRNERAYEPFDLPNPISAYGRTKLAGEEYVKHLSSRWYIVRSAGVYGEGHNFVRTMLRVAREREVLKVKDDEFISPTYARDLGEGIAEVVETGLYGLYHLTNSGSCSWHEFSREIVSLCGIEVQVVPVPSSEYPLPAPRPVNGVLSALGSSPLRHWREALADYLKKEDAARRSR
jgi:dTDP-4-dehydrorhamnose reductase